MNYEKLYKNALERAREQYNKRTPLYDIEYIFPELQEQESEDEKIKKAIHIYLDWLDGRKNCAPKGNYSIKDMIAWLEKHGKQIPVEWSEEDEKIKREIVAYINELADLKNEKIPTKWLTWLEDQQDYIKFPNSAYTSNKDVIEFADKYSHDVWEKLMDNFKKIENYHIGCNDVSDIVLNAIINTYNWLEKQGKEEHVLKSSRDKDVDKFMQYIEKEAKAYDFNLPNRGYDIYAFAKDILHWLEKQDEKKSIFNADDWYVSEVDGKIHNPKFIEKQDEKKSTDKIEPKFHEGDWVINNVCLPMQIASIKDDMYIFTKGDAMSVLFIDGNFHLWTIEDAMDGDVLIKEETEEPFIHNGNRGTYIPEFLGAYCGIENGEFKPNGSPYYWGRPACPATKEQRDLLFQKIKEEGYEWDIEKKELKKIEVVSKESEDERIKKTIIRILRGEIGYTSKEDIDEYVIWLEKQGENKPAKNAKLLDADKVIEWLKPLHHNRCIINRIIDRFKEDFGL